MAINNNKYFFYLENYFRQYHNMNISRNCKVCFQNEVLEIGSYLLLIKILYQKKELSEDIISRLLSIGFVFAFEDLWNLMYQLLCNYYDDNGNVDLSSSFVYSVGGMNVDLGYWLSQQIELYSKNKLSNSQVKLLNKLNIKWSSTNDEWFNYFLLAKKYYQENHHLNIPTSYQIIENQKIFKLGRWLYEQKKLYRFNRLSTEKIELLNKIGIFWNSDDEKNCVFPLLLAKYYQKNHNINVPNCYIEKHNNKDYPLGKWLSEIRKKYRLGLLSPLEIDYYEKYHIIWNYNESSWYTMYSLAKEYYELNQHLMIPRLYTITKGNDIYHLGKWLSKQRFDYKNKSLDETQIKLLEDIGIKWEIRKKMDDSFDAYDELKEYYYRNGNILLPSSYVDENGFDLGRWLSTQRRKYRNNSLELSKAKILEEMGIIWNKKYNLWLLNFEKLKQYQSQYKHLSDMRNTLPQEYQKILAWIRIQRRNYHLGILEKEKISLLNGINFVWEPDTNKWYQRFCEVKKYYESYHSLKEIARYSVLIDGKLVNLGNWLYNQKKLYNTHQLDMEKKKLLKSIGIIWNSDDLWNKYYFLALEYYKNHGDLRIKKDYKALWNGSLYMLGKWIMKQRFLYRNNSLKEEQVKLLEKIGMIWSYHKDDLRIICEKYGIDYDKHKKQLKDNDRVLLLEKINYLLDREIPFVGSNGRINKIFSMDLETFNEYCRGYQKSK